MYSFNTETILKYITIEDKQLVNRNECLSHDFDKVIFTNHTIKVEFNSVCCQLNEGIHYIPLKLLTYSSVRIIDDNLNDVYIANSYFNDYNIHHDIICTMTYCKIKFYNNIICNGILYECSNINNISADQTKCSWEPNKYSYETTNEFDENVCRFVYGNRIMEIEKDEELLSYLSYYDKGICRHSMPPCKQIVYKFEDYEKVKTLEKYEINLKPKKREYKINSYIKTDDQLKVETENFNNKINNLLNLSIISCV